MAPLLRPLARFDRRAPLPRERTWVRTRRARSRRASAWREHWLTLARRQARVLRECSALAWVPHVAAPALAMHAGAGGLPRRHEALLAAADQIRAPHALQRLAQHRPVVRVVIAEERLVEPALVQIFHDVHALARLERAQRVEAGVIHRGRARHR